MNGHPTARSTGHQYLPVHMDTRRLRVTPHHLRRLLLLANIISISKQCLVVVIRPFSPNYCCCSVFGATSIESLVEELTYSWC